MTATSESRRRGQLVSGNGAGAGGGGRSASRRGRPRRPRSRRRSRRAHRAARRADVLGPGRRARVSAAARPRVRRRRPRRAVAFRRLRGRGDLAVGRLRDAVRRGADRATCARAHRRRDADRRRASGRARARALARDAAAVSPASGARRCRSCRWSWATRRRRRRTRSATRSRRRCAAARALLVASTDLSHYHDATTAPRSTRSSIDCVSRFDADGLQRALDARPDHACGGGPTVAVMRAAQPLGARDAVVLNYADSGDVSGDKSAVVGYLAAAFGTFRTLTAAATLRSTQVDRSRDRGCCRPALCDLASRVSMHDERARSPTPAASRPRSDRRARRRGARACARAVRGAGQAGRRVRHPAQARRAARLHRPHRGDRAARHVVPRCAVAAGTTDPRFPPVTPTELEQLEIEMSLLGPLEPIAGPQDIEVGRHGLVVEMGWQRGLLLPQVATEWNWDARRSSRRPATKPACRATPGSRARRSGASRRRCSGRAEGQVGQEGQVGRRVSGSGGSV